MNNKIRIGITGSSGFLGRYLLDEIQKITEAEIIVYSSSLQKVKEAKNFILLDLSSAAIQEVKPVDYLFHLAWIGLPNYGSEVHEEQVLNHLEFLKKNIDQGTRKIFVSGTEAEYGNKAGPLSEDHFTSPVSEYAKAKLKLLHKINTLNVNQTTFVWGRIFHTFGDGQPTHTLYGALMEAIKKGETEFPVKYPDLELDFVSASELAANILKLTMSPASEGVYNLGCGKPSKLGDLAISWAKGQKSDIRIVRGSSQGVSFWSDSRKLSNALNSEEEKFYG